MVFQTSILVAHGDANERARIEEALREAGYDVLGAETGEDALRTAVGLNPSIVICSSELPKIPGRELPLRLGATGLEVPTFVVLTESSDRAPTSDNPAVYTVAADASAHKLVDAARLILVSKEIDGEFGGRLDVLYSDLARVPLGDLVRALRRHVVSGLVRFDCDAGLWFVEGSVVDAWDGPVGGVKAFNRIAGLRGGAFSLRLIKHDGKRTIDGDPDAMVLEAVEERLGFHELLSTLPSLDARPEVRIAGGFFDLELSAVERSLLAKVPKIRSFKELLDAVEATDLDTARAAERLHRHGVLCLEEPAGRVHVFTDSTADLLPSEARQLGVQIVAASIVFGSEVLKDGVDLTPEAFLRKLSTEGQVPATHPPSTGEILEAYRHVAASGDILGIYCSSKLSGSFENARLAVEEGRDELRALRVEAQVSSGPVLLTIDSGQCSGLLAMQVVFAVRLLRQGIEVQEVAERLGSIGGRQKSLLVVADPELVTGRGDLAAARAAAAGGRGRSLIRLGDGDLSVVARFDDPQAARVEAVRLLKDELAPDRPVFASLVHASAPADVAALQELVTSSFRVVELQQRQMGPAVTCHTGPGTVGVGLFQPTEEELELLRPQ